MCSYVWGFGAPAPAVNVDPRRQRYNRLVHLYYPMISHPRGKKVIIIQLYQLGPESVQVYQLSHLVRAVNYRTLVREAN